MNFNQRSPKHLKWIQNNGCAMISALFQINYFCNLDRFGLIINDWYRILQDHNCFTKKGYLIWRKLENIFKEIKVTPHLWDEDRGHLHASKIGNYAVASVDMQMATSEYDATHFIAITGFTIDDILIFDPYFNEYTAVTKRYGKKSPIESFYSVINIERI